MRAMHDPSADAPPGTAELDYLMPLHFFLGALRPLEVRFLPGRELPGPARELLVHDSDMTPTLRAHHGCDITLEVCARQESEACLMRAVVLRRSDTGAPVEFGAIGIRLGGFDAGCRGAVLAGERPLGAILEEHEVEHSSHPRAYFEITIDERLAELLDAVPGSVHFGRCNELRDGQGIVFADIVEILP